MPYLVLVLTGVVSLFLGHRVALVMARRRMKRRFARGKVGERRARKALEERGFTILAEQPSAEGTVWLDNVEHHFSVNADFLVQRDGERAVVEVKRGRKVADPLYGATRRQLLEYEKLYDVDRLYFMDGETLQMVDVRFSRGRRSALGHHLWRWLLRILVALAVVLGVWWGSR